MLSSFGCYADPYNIPDSSQKIIRRASHCRWSFIQNMSVNHGRLQILVSEKLLNCSYIVSIFKKMCRKGMTESMACRSFYKAGFHHGIFDQLLYNCFMNMMPAMFTSFFVMPQGILRKYPLPAPFLGSIRIFAH